MSLNFGFHQSKTSTAIIDSCPHQNNPIAQHPYILKKGLKSHLTDYNPSIPAGKPSKEQQINSRCTTISFHSQEQINRCPADKSTQSPPNWQNAQQQKRSMTFKTHMQGLPYFIHSSVNYSSLNLSAKVFVSIHSSCQRISLVYISNNFSFPANHSVMAAISMLLTDVTYGTMTVNPKLQAFSLFGLCGSDPYPLAISSPLRDGHFSTVCLKSSTHFRTHVFAVSISTHQTGSMICIPHTTTAMLIEALNTSML